jgi:DDE superfamily endonuclease
VDGHNSHYTRGFLEYAREANIHVLCYPSHGTHVYQGLDVVIFSALKTYWTQERDLYERTTGQKVSKTNFLAIYGKAHIRAFTPENIKAAFRKTGVVPLNRNVVTDAMMAPSLETSCEGNLPLTMSTPIRYINNVFHELSRPQPERNEETHEAPNSDSQTHLLQIAAAAAVHDLAETEVGFLFSQEPVQSTSQLPPLPTTTISPLKARNQDLLAVEPETEMERKLQEALREANDRNAAQKGALLGLQSTAVLHDRYCEIVRSQLAGQEEKKLGKRKGKLVGDGMPRLLTDADFIARVVAHTEEQERVLAAAAARKVAKTSRKVILDQWEADKERRTKENEVLLAEWNVVKAAWEARRDAMKEDGKKRGWGKQPPRPQMVPAIPKPKAQTVADDDAEDEEGSVGKEYDDFE